MRVAPILLTSFLLTSFLPASPAAALTITSAKVDHSAVQVKGKDATPSASITWQGAVVAAASRSGAFRFTTTDLPSDCSGDVGDGTSAASTVVSGCAPKPGHELVVTDANGKAIGPYIVDPYGAFTADAVGVATADGAILASFFNEGFDPSPFVFYFASTDCTGDLLLPTVHDFVTRARNVVDGVAYYARQTGSQVTLRSRGNFLDSTNACPGGDVFMPPNFCCCIGPSCMTPLATEAASPGMIHVGGFVPPFHVELR